MNPFAISREPVIYRWIDGVVVLIIGMVLGIVISQGVAFFEMGTITTTEVIRRVPLQQSEVEGTSKADMPDDFIPFEDI